MQTMVTIAKAYVEGCVNWLCPFSVSFKAIPNAFTDITDTEPTVEHMEIKIRGLFFPYFGAILYIMTKAKTATAMQ